jgi:hypothetical protein
MKDFNGVKDYLKGQLGATVDVLVENSEEDIIHDYGSMDNFYDVIIDRVEELRKLNNYKLSLREKKLLKIIIK